MEEKKRFIVTARKWRPQRFDDLIGQEALAQALKHALQTGKTAHAYLFSGIRGVGKTSTARLLAKALNCLRPQEGEPCNTCEACVSINDGSAIDVIEIDGASNRGIDAIRDLKETVNYLPVTLRYKVYIIDEAHMLTTEASNALLKTLEEPPEHVVFILATTEVHKLLPTIRSRCQHYTFKKIPVSKITRQLMTICETEGYTYDKEALSLIAEAGDGSLRDAESIFDQVVIYTGGALRLESVKEVLGISPETYYEDLWRGILAGDSMAVLRAIDAYMQEFGDVRDLVWGMVGFLKSGLLIKKLPPGDEMLDMGEAKYQRRRELFASVEAKDILRMMQVMAEFLRGLRGDQYERLAAELVFLQLVDYKNMIPLSEIRDELLKKLPVSPPQSPSRTARPTQAEPPVGRAKPMVSAQPPKSTPSGPTSSSASPVSRDPASTASLSAGTVIKESTFATPQEALWGFLQSSTMTRQMVKEIGTTEWDGQVLTVHTRARYVADYLRSASSKIQAFIEKHLSLRPEVRVVLEGEAVSPTPARGSVPSPASQEAVSLTNKTPDTASPDNHPAEAEGDIVLYAEKLFQGKKR